VLRHRLAEQVDHRRDYAERAANASIAGSDPRCTGPSVGSET